MTNPRWAGLTETYRLLSGRFGCELSMFSRMRREDKIGAKSSSRPFALVAMRLTL